MHFLLLFFSYSMRLRPRSILERGHNSPIKQNSIKSYHSFYSYIQNRLIFPILNERSHKNLEDNAGPGIGSIKNSTPIPSTISSSDLPSASQSEVTNIPSQSQSSSIPLPSSNLTDEVEDEITSNDIEPPTKTLEPEPPYSKTELPSTTVPIPSQSPTPEIVLPSKSPTTTEIIGSETQITSGSAVLPTASTSETSKTSSQSNFPTKSFNPSTDPTKTTQMTTKAEPTKSQKEEDADEEKTQRYFLIALCSTFAIIAFVVVGIYMYCTKRYEEEQNPEYTRAILGDDAFEFSQLQTL